MIRHRIFRRRFLILLLCLLVAIVLWQLPAILKTIPSRYVAAYLPESVQSLAEREHVETLPTAAAAVMDDNLLLETEEKDESPVLLEPTRPIESIAPVPSNTPTIEVPMPSQGTKQIETAYEQQPPSAALPAIMPTSIPIPESARLMDFQHHFQTWNNCGPATLAMGLSYFDIAVSQEDTASVLKPNPEDRNVSPFEMTEYVNSYSNLSAINRVNGDLDTIFRFIANGYPVIIELGLDPPGEYRWMDWYGHYLLVVAYDISEEKVWVYDSWFGTSLVPGENADSNGREIAFDELDRYWEQFNRNYLVLFDSNKKSEVEGIIGPMINDDFMWQTSLEAAQNAIASDPENEFLWFNLGTSYNALGDYDRAAATYDKARAIGLPWRMLWYQFGPYEAYYQTGRYDDVILLADVTLQDRPYFEESYYYKGLALEALGKAEEARSNYEKAIKFNPRFVSANIAIENLEG